MLVFTCYPTSGAVQILHTTYIKIEAKTFNVFTFDRFGQAPSIRVNNLLKISSEYYLPFELIKWMKSFLQMHTGCIEVIMRGKCGRNAETTFDIK